MGKKPMFPRKKLLTWEFLLYRAVSVARCYEIGVRTMEYTARILSQGNGTFLVYGINAYGNRHGVFATLEAAEAWAREYGFTRIVREG